ncbi:hypothetical protein A2662_00075 [Candidatus Giovannonibacteria bacterium RIFCSPHIGHO2_01_FULL_45_33]|uniref:Uncharacterized protein n=1 Tax=Candidatus Giovannonibacteria bacterium RIFCSPLOWO2_01_FULL_45_34 TaxID=1798351 RepID=A0A1F5WZ47_9BACT|nr:MAG: hypothetical protein A2662_00075 [Candidatus Giovannonibacteria bacterium RIFCSPHIGHO2_01_FULL_45_33]OGF80883.1 MAG: hypothetical protein A2930_01045 [Candidatus Giovannonibacteria bacterium RIFCSPLOWO2_01_FULL_45_34]
MRTLIALAGLVLFVAVGVLAYDFIFLTALEMERVNICQAEKAGDFAGIGFAAANAYYRNDNDKFVLDLNEAQDKFEVCVAGAHQSRIVWWW